MEGDPAKEGPFVMRLLVPDGYHIPPHAHPKTERVIVISGAFYLAMGDKLDQAINYAQNRASFRSGEIGILDSSGNVERVIAFNETERKL